MSRWLEVGPDNYVLTTQGSLLNTGLVVGTERAMVIDTGGGPRQGREILAAVREKTGLPLVVVNTHAHYDHFFGNAVFASEGVTEFWHTRTAVPFGPFMLVAAWGSILGASGLGDLYLARIGA